MSTTNHQDEQQKARVLSWLSHLPPATIQTTKPSTTTRTKRKRANSLSSVPDFLPSPSPSMAEERQQAGVETPTTNKRQRGERHEQQHADEDQDGPFLQSTPRPKFVVEIPLFPDVGVSQVLECDTISVISSASSASTTSSQFASESPTRPPPILRSSRAATISSSNKRKRGDTERTEQRQIPTKTSGIPHVTSDFRMLAVAKDRHPALWRVYTQLSAYSNGQGVLPADMKDGIRHFFGACSPAALFDLDPDSVYDASELRSSLGRPPPPSVIRSTVDRCCRAKDKCRSEGVWLSQVNCPLLDAAFDDYDGCGTVGGSNGNTKLEHIVCLTSQLDPRFLGSQDPSRMIDSMIGLDTSRSSLPDPLKEALLCHLQRIKVSDKAGRIYEPLGPWADITIQDHLLCLPIEMKKLGTGYTDSGIQITVWLRAMWRYLSASIHKRLSADNGARGTVAGAEVDSASLHHDLYRRVAEQLEELGFLPGLIIRGDTWEFVAMTVDATSRKPASTTLWGRRELGSPETELGYYKIVACLQYLAHWARTVYWPWFCRSVFGVGD